MYNQADSLYLENEKDLYHKGKLLIYLPTTFSNFAGTPINRLPIMAKQVLDFLLLV